LLNDKNKFFFFFNNTSENEIEKKHQCFLLVFLTVLQKH